MMPPPVYRHTAQDAKDANAKDAACLQAYGNAKATATPRQRMERTATPRHTANAVARCKLMYACIVYIRLHTCKGKFCYNARKKWAEKFANAREDVDGI